MTSPPGSPQAWPAGSDGHPPVPGGPARYGVAPAPGPQVWGPPAPVAPPWGHGAYGPPPGHQAWVPVPAGPGGSPDGGSGETRGKWLAGIVASAVIGPLAVFFLTREGGPLNPEDPPPLGGDISAVELSTANPCCSFSVNFQLEGYRGQDVTIEAVITEATTGVQSDPFPVTVVQPEADRDQAVITSEVPLEAGTFTVTYVLIDPDGMVLDRMTSGPVEVS